jgi:hypothetical protein
MCQISLPSSTLASGFIRFLERYEYSVIGLQKSHTKLPSEDVGIIGVSANERLDVVFESSLRVVTLASIIVFRARMSYFNSRVCVKEVVSGARTDNLVNVDVHLNFLSYLGHHAKNSELTATVISPVVGSIKRVRGTRKPNTGPLTV